MQPKRPRFNPLILALALAGVLMIWSVLGTSDSSTGGSTMSYSTVVHYFENNQVTAFTLDRNTSIITLTLKEGKQELPETTGATAATQASGGLLSNMFSSSTSSVGATRNDDGTVTVRYKLPYAYVFIENVQQYIDSYDAANPTAPMEYDYTTLKESIPWMEILFYLGMLGCTGFLLFSMMRGGAGGGGIMNVGKAKALKNRVSQYFANLASHTEKTRAMVSQIDHFDVIVADSEFEALILENSLIKRHQPHYNILLKDDKGYPYIRLTVKEPYPRFSLANRAAEDGARYFGPYGSRGSTQNIIDALRVALKLPSCSRKFPRDIGKERPCLNYHMGQCDGYCRKEMDQTRYREAIDQAVRLLEGQFKEVGEELLAEMEQAAEELRALVPPEGPVLVLGVGNRRVTADALGPRTTQKIFVTMGAGRPPVQGIRPVAAVAPGVSASTGLSLQQLAGALVREVRPTALICVDSLCSSEPQRLGRTLQFSDAGLCPAQPGSTRHLDTARLGLPVIAAGIPTLMAAQEGKDLVVTPRELDSVIAHGAALLGAAINRALQPRLSIAQLCWLAG